MRQRSAASFPAEGSSCDAERVEGPYREPKPLSELIPPDRRRQKLALVILVSMVSGAVLYQCVRASFEDRGERHLPPPPPVVTTAAPPPAPPSPAGSSGALTPMEIENVVASRRKAIHHDCWGRLRPEAGSVVKVTLEIVVGANGDVVSAVATGTDALVASCIETNARRWQFPAHGERSGPIRIPFIFKAQ
jgi:hypothetical protein